MLNTNLKTRLISGEIVEYEKGSDVIELGFVKKTKKFVIIKNGICIKDAKLFPTIEKKLNSTKYKEYKEVVLCA